jgi:hypothetical protein
MRFVFLCMDACLVVCEDRRVEKPRLVLKPTPSGDPLLRGFYSQCPHVTFAFVGNTEDNLKLMHHAFERHVLDVHPAE